MDITLNVKTIRLMMIYDTERYPVSRMATEEGCVTRQVTTTFNNAECPPQNENENENLKEFSTLIIPFRQDIETPNTNNVENSP
jgi:hypothetical protein